MIESILTAVKKNLNILEADKSYDDDVILFINSALSTLDQIGVGPEGGFFIEDEAAEWADLAVPPNQMHLLKSWLYLKVRLLFDPPGTSFLVKAMEDQIAQFEWRLNMQREVLLPSPIPTPTIPEDL